MKINVMLESFGERVRLSLSPMTIKEKTRRVVLGYAPNDEVAKNMFANLLWILGGNGNEESFIVARETLVKAIQAFRVANPTQGRRGKGLWKASPFSFSLVSQRNDTREIASNMPHAVGNADYSNATDSEFNGFSSRLAMDNAEV
jgi:hypothetical protein